MISKLLRRLFGRAWDTVEVPPPPTRGEEWDLMRSMVRRRRNVLARLGAEGAIHRRGAE